jgi:hypothetical protein
VRRQLAKDGLRCGIVGSQLPSWVVKRLESQEKIVQLDRRDGAAVISGIPSQHRLQCRAGRARTIVLEEPQTQLTVTCDEEQSEAVASFDNAQCALGLQSDPLGDGRVRVKITPTICHGSPKQRWVGQNGFFRLDTAQDRVEYDRLAVTATLTAGQTLLLSATPTPCGVGKAFLADNPKPGFDRKLLLVRLAQTQIDDLFGPPHASTPIATPAQ